MMRRETPVAAGRGRAFGPPRPPIGRRPRWTISRAGAALLATGGLAALGYLVMRRGRASRPAPTPAPETERSVTARTGQRLNHATGLLAASVLMDSAVEHYRGDFENRAMYTPLAVASLVLGVSLHGARDASPSSHGIRLSAGAIAAATGFVGTGFHVYNVGKRDGGYNLTNLFYSAPLGAPAALTLAGVLCVVAERVRDCDEADPRLLGLPAGPALAAGTAVALMGTVAEVGLLHFRGAFQNPAMYVPILLPPVAAAMLGRAALDAGPQQLARAALAATAIMGVAGVAFHAYGVSRMMGGWRNWSQNFVDGPPLPAPPSFSGLALAGLAALDLLEARQDG